MIIETPAAPAQAQAQNAPAPNSETPAAPEVVRAPTPDDHRATAAAARDRARSAAIEALKPKPATPPATPPEVTTPDDRGQRLLRIVERENATRAEAERVRAEKEAIAADRAALASERERIAQAKADRDAGNIRAAFERWLGAPIDDETFVKLIDQAASGDDPKQAPEVAIRAEIARALAERDAEQKAAEERARAEKAEADANDFRHELGEYCSMIGREFTPDKYPALEAMIDVTEDAIDQRFSAKIAAGVPPESLDVRSFLADWEAEAQARLDRLRPRPTPTVATPRMPFQLARVASGAPAAPPIQPATAAERIAANRAEAKARLESLIASRRA